MLKNKLKKIFSKTIDNSTRQIVDIYDSIKNQWDPIENSQPFPENPTENKDIVGKWKCEKGHFWYETIENRAHYQICHMCYSPRCATEIYNLFYLRPDLDKDWHPTKNKGFTSDEITPGSNKKVWWVCEKGHEWKTQASARTRGNGCPECSNQKVGKDNNLAVLRPDLLVEWDQEANGDLAPQNVIPGSSKKVAWKCEKGHQWKEKIFSRVRREYGCSTCFPQTKNTSNVDKLVLKKKGNNLLPHDLYKEWHPIKNGLFNLENVSLNTNKRACFNL